MAYRQSFKYSGSVTNFLSSAVSEAYYNVDSQELAVVLKGGAGYIYSNVPEFVWSYFTKAPSAGRYYAETIKRNYGPGEYIGYCNEEDEFFENMFDEPAEDEREDSLMDAGNLIVMPNFNNTATFSGDVATTVVNNTFSLSPQSYGEVNKRKHILNFRVDGQSVIRTHTVQAVNLEDAIQQLREVADMLDLVFEVTSATVVFSE